MPIANNLRVLVMSEFAKATGSAMGAVLSAFLPFLSTVTTGLVEGAQLLMLELGYQARIGWYVDDVDRS